MFRFKEIIFIFCVTLSLFSCSDQAGEELERKDEMLIKLKNWEDGSFVVSLSDINGEDVSVQNIDTNNVSERAISLPVTLKNQKAYLNVEMADESWEREIVARMPLTLTAGEEKIINLPDKNVKITLGKRFGENDHFGSKDIIIARFSSKNTVIESVRIGIFQKHDGKYSANLDHMLAGVYEIEFLGKGNKTVFKKDLQVTDDAEEFLSN